MDITSDTWQRAPASPRFFTGPPTLPGFPPDTIVHNLPPLTPLTHTLTPHKLPPPSVVSLPVRQDHLSFQEQQRQFDEMSSTFDSQRREMEENMEQMRQSFFQLKPFDAPTSPRLPAFSLRSPPAARGPAGDSRYKVDTTGANVFQIRFDVAGFNPEEIRVNTEGRKLQVYALHKEQNNNSTVTQEFRRQVEIPDDVRPESIKCVLSTDGVLSLEAPTTQAVPPSSPRSVQFSPPAGRSFSTTHSTTPDRNRYSGGVPAGSRYSSGAPDSFEHDSLESINTRQQNNQRQFSRPPPHSSSAQAHIDCYSPAAASHVDCYSPAAASHVQQVSLPVNDGLSPPGFPSAHSPGTSTPSFPRVSPIFVDENGTKKMVIKIPAGEFRPEELHVRTHDRRLHITASHEHTTCGRTVTKRLTRDYDLPDDVCPDDVTAHIDEEKALVVEAPLTQSRRTFVNVNHIH